MEHVEPEAREVGLGEELLDAVIAWSRARGCSTLDAVALPGDRHTKNFFETFGMKARLLTVHVPLVDPAAPMRTPPVPNAAKPTAEPA